MRLYLRPFLFLSILWLLFGINGIKAVSADTGTPPVSTTPTPEQTWEPLYKTPTIAPTRDLRCSGTQPSGWGTVTPSSRWLYSCSQCVTQTPSGFWFNDTPTPTAVPCIPKPTVIYQGTPMWEYGCNTATPAPSPTVTVTPTPAPSGDMYYFKYVPINETITLTGDLTYQYLTYNSSCNGDDVAMATSLNGAIHVEVSGDWGDTSSWISNDWAIKYAVATGPGIGPKTEEFNICSGQGDGGHIELCEKLRQLQGVTAWSQGVSKNYNNAQDGYVYANGWKSAAGNYVRVDSVGLLCYGDNYTGATATPTVSPDGYCSVVEPLIDDIGIDLPNFRAAPCRENNRVSIGGWHISKEWVDLVPFQIIVAPEGIDVPLLTVCIRALSLGLLNIFGVSIDLDWIAGILTFTMLIRWFLRS